MRYYTLTVLLTIIFFSFHASAQVKAGTIVRSKVVDSKDSIAFYEVDIASRQKSYINLLTGTWQITTMKKQSRMDPDHLENVSLSLFRDSTFKGQAGCNRIWGRFSLKGTSIKFNEIASTKMTCEKQEEENWLLSLLQRTVSAYSVSQTSLLLRDVASNVVFEGSRKE